MDECVNDVSSSVTTGLFQKSLIIKKKSCFLTSVLLDQNSRALELQVDLERQRQVTLIAPWWWAAPPISYPPPQCPFRGSVV